MSGRKGAFVKDIAKEHKFANQNKEYNEQFAKWRADEKNPYGYKFVQDVREHSYVVDEGYLKSKSDVAEKIALFKCLGLLGAVMIAMLFIYAFKNIFLNVLYPEFSGGVIYYKDKSGLNDNISAWAAFVVMIFDMAKFLIPTLIFAVITKLPGKVAFPFNKCESSVTASSVSILLVIAVMGRICRYLFSQVCAAAGIDAVYMFSYNGSDPMVSVISCLSYCIVLPICIELFFRGVVLQTFRQFGDSFAVTVSTVVSGFICYDVSYIGYALMCSLVLGVFAVKTGSIRTTILMHISAATVNYSLSLISIYGTSVGKIVETAACMLIIGLSIFGYSRLTAREDWNFNLGGDHTEMSFAQKLKILLSTDTVVIWLVAAVTFTFLSYRGLR